MKQLIRIVLTIAGLAISIILLFVGNIIVGDMIARGPISEIHAQIEPSMTRAQVIEIYSQNPEITDLGGRTTMQLTHYSSNITSPVVGSWVCIAKIHFDGDMVEKKDDVFCVD